MKLCSEKQLKYLVSYYPNVYMNIHEYTFLFLILKIGNEEGIAQIPLL